MCCFKTLIAARPAMVASFAPATAIITRNNYTTTLSLTRPGIGICATKATQCPKLYRTRNVGHEIPMNVAEPTFELVTPFWASIIVYCTMQNDPACTMTVPVPVAEP
jgi:hypothetical protein